MKLKDILHLKQEIIKYISNKIVRILLQEIIYIANGIRIF